MSKMLKTVVCCMLILSATTITAAAKNTAAYDSEYAGPDSLFVSMPRVEKMLMAHIEAARIFDLFENYKNYILPHAYVGKLAYIVGRQNVYDAVFAGKKNGFVSSLERVYIYDDGDSKRYYTDFLYYGTPKDGYVDRSEVKAPSNSLEGPTAEERIGQDYCEENGHIVTDAYEVADGKYQSRVYYGFDIYGSKKPVNHGDYVEGNADGDSELGPTRVFYSHISNFEYGVKADATPYYRYRYDRYENIEAVVTYGDTAESGIGCLDNSDQSTESQLHSEDITVDDSERFDPLNYVASPAVRC